MKRLLIVLLAVLLLAWLLVETKAEREHAERTVAPPPLYTFQLTTAYGYRDTIQTYYLTGNKAECDSRCCVVTRRGAVVGAVCGMSVTVLRGDATKWSFAVPSGDCTYDFPPQQGAKK